jgi:uncharacterized protein (TIGR04255 family)
MSNFPKLKNPPIIEALVDFRVQRSEGVSRDALAKVATTVADDFPKRQEVKQVMWEFQAGPGGAQSRVAEETPVGFRMDSADGKRVIQAQSGGFSYSQVNDYSEWPQLVSEARRYWDLFCSIVHPETVSRVATRFINRIDLGPGPVDVDEYLTSGPKIPATLEQLFSEFLSRTVVPVTEIDATIVITQALQPPVKVGMVSILLDIDVFVARSFDVRGSGYWEMLTQLRDLKNRAFFGSVTDKTIQRFME